MIEFTIFERILAFTFMIVLTVLFSMEIWERFFMKTKKGKSGELKKLFKKEFHKDLDGEIKEQLIDSLTEEYGWKTKKYQDQRHTIKSPKNLKTCHRQRLIKRQAILTSVFNTLKKENG